MEDYPLLSYQITVYSMEYQILPHTPMTSGPRFTIPPRYIRTFAISL